MNTFQMLAESGSLLARAAAQLDALVEVTNRLEELTRESVGVERQILAALAGDEDAEDHPPYSVPHDRHSPAA